MDEDGCSKRSIRPQIRGVFSGFRDRNTNEALKAWADGYNGASLYPITYWRNPTPGLYVSADRWVLAATATVALVVLTLDRYLGGNRNSTPRE